MIISSISGVDFKGATSTQNVSEGKDKNASAEKGKTSTKTKVLVGSGLTALAAIGIYLATRKKLPTISQSPKIQDIVEEGVFWGRPYKTIKDGKTGNVKERIDYYSNGKEQSHVWCDGSSSDPTKGVKKEIYYEENGDIRSMEEFMSSGNTSKYVKYVSSESSQKYGQKIFSGSKYYPNGQKRFEMTQPDFMDIGVAKLYDMDGNVIKERTFVSPFGKSRGYKLVED